MIGYEWRGAVGDAELDALHAAAFGAAESRVWSSRLERHSLGWVCARDGDALAGFVNVAWDGASHAFLVDTMVAPELARQGVGTRLVAVAADNARAAGCAWLHVDFEPELEPFYIRTCGFTPTQAGVMPLRARG